MGLIGMTEAARRMGVKNNVSALRALRNAGVPLQRVMEKAMGVEESDLAVYLAKVGENRGKGRPKKESADTLK